METMEENKAIEKVEEKELKGLRGWLILVALGVVISPIKLLVTCIPIYVPIFQNGSWEAITTKGSDFYHPLWAPLIIGEISYNSIMIILSLYLIYLFFTKHYFFPKLYIILSVMSIIFIPLDAWLVTIIVPDNPVLSPETTREFSRILITSLIWIPYMLRSKRVKATFVGKMPIKTYSPVDIPAAKDVQAD